MLRLPAACLAALGLLLVPRLVAGAAPRAAGPNFDRVIAPLLLRHCADCHGGPSPKGGLDLTRHKAARAGGDSGEPALVPGKPDASLLWQRVRRDNMPPKKRLSAAEKATLRAWIAAGARWGTDPLDPFRFTTDQRAGYDWWALRRVVRPKVPAVKRQGWARNPLDVFVLARLEARGLTPAPQADRRTLIRRLSFDLLGLPPEPAEVEAFVKDPDPSAYEKLVERLLASPHHGERWGRHWLDVVRFGESNGFERDQPRPNAWPYRAWVVQALNRDLPYDEFVRLQLAGDVLRPGDPSALAATGFLVAGARDLEMPASAAMRETMRQDALEDVVGTVGQTFLGLTVNCARCHDHKFDPVAQKDYYRLVAALAGVQHGERTVVRASPELAQMGKEIGDLQARLDALEAPVRRRLLARSKLTPGPKPLAEWDFRRGLSDRLGALHAVLRDGAKVERAGLRVDGKTGHAVSAPLQVDLRTKTLEAWVRLNGLGQRGGGVISVQTLDGNVFDAIVFGEQEAGRWMPGSDGFRRTRSLRGPAETQADREAVCFALTYQADGTIRAYRNGVPYGTAYRSSGPVTFKKGKAQVVFGLRHAPVGGNKMLAATIERARLYDRALTTKEVARSAGTHVAEADLVAGLTPEQRKQRQAWKKLLAQRDEQLRQRSARRERRIYAVTPAQPEPTRLLRRGSVTARGERVAAEALSALARFGPAYRLKPDAPEGKRRAALARWITASDNPLVARVLVNRLWHHHFGTGLVDTPNDLGFNGGRPSHPELLDWLAAEFTARKWSVKALHRLIVTSATYRQGSACRPRGRRLDAGNRLLWRRSPQRLEAEAVRDAMLAVSGGLTRTVGGPSYQDFRAYFFRGSQFYEPLAEVGPAFTRRTLYRTWARGGRNPFLDTFDCPDPSTTSPRRAVTTTPLQALALLNNAFVLDSAERFARRVQREAGEDGARQVARVYALAYGRAPTARERGLVTPFVKRHGLAAFCRVVFNSNEFMQVD
jgi:mono/diheme cytochrome c family protein